MIHTQKFSEVQILRKLEISYHVVQLKHNSLLQTYNFHTWIPFAMTPLKIIFFMKEKIDMLMFEIQLSGIWTHINKNSIFHFQSAVQQLLMERKQ